jgi:arginase family enzyme
MIDLKDYFNPVGIESPEYASLTGNSGFSHTITINTENAPIKEIGKYQIALFGVPEDRNSINSGSFKAPDAVRAQLYQLAKIPGKTKIADLGNMKQGVSFNDTVAGLTDILAALIDEDVFPIIIGGSSSVIPAIDKAFALRKHKYTFTSVDSRIDYCHEKKEHDSFNYLNAIINNPKNALRHYINIGYQTYLNDQQVINRFLKKKSELIRIGDVRQAIYLTEPLLRDSDAVVFDISAVRQSDAPGTICPSPNGFYGEEICLLARYSGISDNLKLFGLFEINPDLDIRNQTSALAAQIIWFFIEGFAQKQYEIPEQGQNNSERFKKYHVRVTGLDDDLIFIESKLTERWWLELPDPKEEITYIACSYDDYLTASRNELPDRCVKAMERLNLSS